jgi:hypothetical protein
LAYAFMPRRISGFANTPTECMLFTPRALTIAIASAAYVKR